MLQLGKLSHYCTTYMDCVHAQVISMYVKTSFQFKISFWGGMLLHEIHFMCIVTI